jgi:dinuclear metal center YbgI/SA1388 family protein
VGIGRWPQTQPVPTIQTLYAALDARFSFSRAESWDKTGLLVGDFSAQVRRVLVAYEVTDAALDAARQHECEAVVAYHPLIFRPLEKLDFSDRTAHLCARLIRQNQNLICVHTALDGASPPDALGDALARQLGLENARVWKPSGIQKLIKIVVFVPIEAVDDVCNALWQSGAGHIGRYDEASFQTTGTGTFRPLEGASPRVGEIGKRHSASEVRLEVVAPEARWKSIVAAMKNAHPYEEVAYDVLALENSDSNQTFGPLRIHDLSGTPFGPLTPIEPWIERAKSALKVSSVRVVVPSHNNEYAFVACSPGSGASFIPALPPSTIFISGDFKHHDALLAKSRGIALIDVTHAATETASIELMAGALETVPDLEIVRDAMRNPFNFA